jgi:hypothetical protein
MQIGALPQDILRIIEARRMGKNRHVGCSREVIN